MQTINANTLRASNGVSVARRVLPDLTEEKTAIPSTEQLLAMIAELQAQNAKLATSRTNAFRTKVSEKGCLTVGGGRLRRMGVTLYATEWQTILDNADKIKAAIEANRAALAWKE